MTLTLTMLETTCVSNIIMFMPLYVYSLLYFNVTKSMIIIANGFIFLNE